MYQLCQRTQEFGRKRQRRRRRDVYTKAASGDNMRTFTEEVSTNGRPTHRRARVSEQSNERTHARTHARTNERGTYQPKTRMNRHVFWSCLSQTTMRTREMATVMTSKAKDNTKTQRVVYDGAGEEHPHDLGPAGHDQYTVGWPCTKKPQQTLRAEQQTNSTRRPWANVFTISKRINHKSRADEPHTQPEAGKPDACDTTTTTTGNINNPNKMRWCGTAYHIIIYCLAQRATVSTPAATTMRQSVHTHSRKQARSARSVDTFQHLPVHA